MARIRTLKPEFWTSEQVVDCSPNARLLFIGLLNFADDRGVLKNSPRTIKASVFPADDGILSDSVRLLVGELVKNGLLGVFDHEGVEFLHVLKFSKHQRVDKPTYKYPTPPKSPAGYKEWSSNGIGLNGDLFDERSTPEGNGTGREGKGREGREGAREQSSNGRGSDSKSPSRGSRLAEDWKPSDANVEFAKDRGFSAIQIVDVARQFVRYWTGPDARSPAKKDWDRTWENWVEREAQRPGALRKPAASDDDPNFGVRSPNALEFELGYKSWLRSKIWPINLGPKPDEPGCYLPVEIRDKVDGMTERKQG